MAPLASRDTIAPPALPAQPGGAHATPDPHRALAALDAVRRRTLDLVEHLDENLLSAQHSPIMSPLVWDLAHIAAYEDLWLCHRHAGMDLLHPDLAAIYDAFETPRSVRGEIELLGPAAARRYLADVRERTAQGLLRVGVGDGTLLELVLRHELQHTETMLQTMALAALLPDGETLSAAGCEIGPASPPPADAQRWVEVPAGEFLIGAAAEGFAYDNERPRHAVRVDAFAIARLPVSNGEWQAAGGERYGGGSGRRGRGGGSSGRRDDGGGGGRGGGGDDEPVCHVSWHEADAFARAQGARLPTEGEWEIAARAGALAQVGRVWEWSGSDFGPYPGFVAHPYREYSEVFFGEDYKVLRGGSWATHPRVKTLSFRNWDLPIRSQIFAGVRLVRDVS